MRMGRHDIRDAMNLPRPLVLIAVAATLVAAGAGATVFLARPAFLFPAPAEPAREVRAPADPLRRLPDDLVGLLTRPGMDAPSPFLRLTRVRPEGFCRSFSRWGLKNPAFRQNEPPQRGWTCITDLVKPIDGDEAEVSSLFVAARGLDDDRVDNIRMKLNLLEPSSAPLVKLIARDALTEISRSFGWEPPVAVLEALERLKEGRILDRGISYDLRKEFGEAPRYNVMIIFPRLLGAGGEGRFVTDIRRGPVTR